jgi:3-oxoadipate CoA-transferase beta subunit
MNPLTRREIAQRAALDLNDGDYVNLGIGIPTLVALYLDPQKEIVLHSENGILGMGPNATGDDIDPYLINAGKEPVTLVTGAAIFDHSDSFVMVRGGHIDVALLGAFQVSQGGDLANWTTGGIAKAAVGGAMDLAVGARHVRVLCEHRTRHGDYRLLRECTYPLTAPRCVERVYTDVAVLDVAGEDMVVREMLEELSFDDLQQMTGAQLVLAPDCRPYRASIA